MAFGFRAIRRIDGSPYNGEHSPYSILANAAVIYNNAPVTFQTDGTIKAKAAGDEHLGVLLGVEYRTADGDMEFKNHWPGSTAGATDIVAHVADDPNLIFEVEVVDEWGAVNDPEVRGLNADVYVPTPAGTARTGISGAQLGDYVGDQDEGVYKVYRKSPVIAGAGLTSKLVWVTVVKHSLLTVTSRTGAPAT
jgi:hypothetical protein